MTEPAPRSKTAARSPDAPLSKTAPRRSPRRGGAVRVIIEIIAALFLLSLTVPWEPGSFAIIGPEEYSWMLMVHRALATGMQFGRQIVMPEGPLAFLGNDVYEPHTYPLLILARTIIALVAFWSLQELGRAFLRSRTAALFWLLAVVLLMGTTPDCFFPDCAILLILNYFLVHRRKLSASAIAMLIVLGAASLIKTNQMLYSSVAMSVLTIDQIVQRHRRAYLPPCIYLGSVILFYFAARQSPSSIGSFLHGWWLVLIGHANGAALSGPMSDAVLYLLVSAAAIALIGWSQWKPLRWAALCPVAGIAATLLLLYKHSFVRQDVWHVVIAPTSQLALLVLYLPAIWRESPMRMRLAALFVTASSLGFFFWIPYSYTNLSPLKYVLISLEKSGSNAMAVAKHFTDPDRLTRLWEADRAAIRKNARLPRDKITGTVDVYPHWEDVVFAYDLPYSPRPVCNSYVANTPVLASLNARHLASPDAAETILFDIAGVDDKFPTMLDGASIPELMSRYDLIDRTGSLLILRRAPAPRRFYFTPLSVQSARFGQNIDVPDLSGGMVWVRIHFKKQATYGLISALYKPALLHINVILASRRRIWFALLPDLADQGFLLSPLMNTRAVMADLYHDPPSPLLLNQQVERFKITVSDPSLGVGLDPDFTVTFDRLQFTPPPGHVTK